ncbi:MAG: hypothetical protein COB15_00890 [Flavobacteriales bacterium]|nr:MAG: hypothetical protein COB15_00890 [Flavobacteriales bacterium]
MRILFFIVGLFVSVSFYSQNGMGEYDTPLYLSEIGECPSCVEMLVVNDTNNMSELVKECSNISLLILENTSIDSLPSYFSEFKKLEKIRLTKVLSVPSNFEIIENLKSLDLIECQNLKFDSVFFKSISLNRLKIWECSDLNLSYLSASTIFFARNKLGWNNGKEIIIDNCKELIVFESDYNIVYDLNLRSHVKKMHFEMCGDVIIGDKFYEKFNRISEIEIGR